METSQGVLALVLSHWNRLSLAAKFNLVFCVAGIAGLLLGAIALDHAVSPAFDRIERDDAVEQVERAKAKLQSEQDFAQSSTTDYAFWDDAFSYVRDNNPHFANVIASPLAVTNTGNNMLAFVRFDGQPRIIRYVDLESGKQDELRTALAASFARSPGIVNLMRGRKLVSGFITMHDRILAVAMGQVRKSDASGSPEGYVIMGKELGAKELSAALQTPAKVQLGSKLPPLSSRNAEAWNFAVPVRGLDGHTLGYLDFRMPRDVTAQGVATLRAASLTSALRLLLVLGVIYLAFSRVVVRRIRAIDAGVAAVAGEGKLMPLEHDPSEDELGALNHNFNRMVAQLKDLQEQIEAQSFQLGRDESMAGILHNVRNSLNPVTVIVGQVVADRSQVSNQNVARALQELEVGDAEPERRKRLVAYLTAALQELERNEESRRDALLTAKASLAEAMEILRSRGDTSSREIPLESVDLVELVSRNASVCRYTPWGEIAVELPRGAAAVKANRLLLSQVIGNLMTNAVEAIVRAGRKPGHMKVTLCADRNGPDGCYDLTFADDGCGFEPSSVTKLFERGQTSKMGRSGGLGLHWCANTVRAMGGQLTLESDGEGKGARATLRLPAAT